MKSRLVFALSILSLSLTVGAAAIGCDEKRPVEAADAAPAPATPKIATSAVPPPADASTAATPIPSTVDAGDGGGKAVDAAAKAAPAKK